jgi:hypothetical protein
MIDWEQTQLTKYPETELLVSGTAYMFSRNCLDFAWGPYMGPVQNVWLPQGAGPQPLVPQGQAWWMGDLGLQAQGYETLPRANWKEQSPSMVDAVQSQQGPGAAPEVLDFLFNTADLNPLQYEYEDMLGSMSGILEYNPRNMIGLPVCNLATLDDIPVHSAVLIDWLTPGGMAPNISAGVFISKWGNGGIFKHRWGNCLCPDDYCDNTKKLHVFVPSSAWGGLMYWVYYSPW